MPRGSLLVCVINSSLQDLLTLGVHQNCFCIVLYNSAMADLKDTVCLLNKYMQGYKPCIEREMLTLFSFVGLKVRKFSVD